MRNTPPPHEHIDTDMIKLEVNLDDTTGEWLGYVLDLLFEHGANDVYYTPIYMKKNRPGVLLQVLCSVELLDKMKELIFRETTTLGIRYYPLTVHRLERSFIKVATELGEVTVKIGSYQGQVMQWAPEYEECKRLAQQHQLPLKAVYDAVRRAQGNNRL
ncbi:hypothetical protein J40TS1_18590 [Paenibacillus montaniterrae]|uniref:DUF111 family protein n=1 Tax=Paenibacillus montaniterrae TaxID=429341 RepID=A0A919YKR3_9BACL|nr:nickel insertion protein [Paenibacillus montaniterrae]GIP16217.1 hypothetical protein J40TS1_18590 [Paenibacillus montaniterrae]